ncbi:hypothetical protein UMM65_08335 [Aureibaculum sp. 2210JD6-5]|uniref:hypothetical protein n=1 Tax=Aureibaculum sp. 2210JD6-5 TaxID=3103957 RepID=UPI002AAEED2A|nr:hypothetical protein [Aureibaculum sp. 2210JD6-5]MDY7395248.1 hypothetical protein [Aureibaculum sp. 2210JD6-5]
MRLNAPSSSTFLYLRSQSRTAFSRSLAIIDKIMNTISTSLELIRAINNAPDFEGRTLLKLTPNTIFEIDQTLWIRKRLIIDGQGSVIKFKGDITGIKIGEDYTIDDEFRPETKYDSTYTIIKDLDLIGDSTLSNRSGIGILCWSHGLRLNNIRFSYWREGILCDGELHKRNVNNTSFRDLLFRLCDTAIYFSGRDADAGIIDGCEIVGCETGIKMTNITYQNFSNVYFEAVKHPIDNSSTSDYSTWVGCGTEGAAISNKFKGAGTIAGGNLVSAARKVNASGERIGRGDSRLSFTVLDRNDSKKGVRVFIPGNFYGVPSPMQFIQLENIFPDDTNRPRNELHGISYDSREQKYRLGTRAWKIKPNSVGCEWKVE